MPIIGFPFDNVEYDASALGAWLCTRTLGVFAADGHYTVAIDGDLSVSVSSGVAWLQMGAQWGVVAPNAASVSLPVAAGDGSLNRIDAVCLRINKNTSAIELLVKQGDLAAVPVIPAIERDLDYDEIYLATISVPAGTTELTAAQLTDQRLNTEYCGVMRDGVTGIPTAQIQAQAEALMQILRNEIANINAGSEMMLKTEYAPDATAAMAGGVLTVTSTYTHPGTDYDVRFVAPDGFDGAETFTLDGATVTVRGADMVESSLEAVPGAVVNLSRHGDDVFPKSGGGGFNLRVFGGSSRPASPKEGDIWMQGAVIVGKPWYRVNPPASPVQRQVWVPCASESNKSVQVAANALVPVSSPQWYNNGVWVEQYSEIYTGGAWNKFYLYLFGNGTYNQIFKLISTSGAGSDSLSVQSNAIIMGATYSGGAVAREPVFCLLQKVDATSIGTLSVKFNYVNAQGGGVKITSADGSVVYFSNALSTVTFNLGGISGQIDIRISIAAGVGVNPASVSIAEVVLS